MHVRENLASRENKSDIENEKRKIFLRLNVYCCFALHNWGQKLRVKRTYLFYQTYAGSAKREKST